ncbi:TetR/AcrR family transcriptional regulator [Azospirillum palustre]
MKKSEPQNDEVRRTRGRPRGFDRDEALAHAVRLFWQHGYEGTSVSELVKELGINPPALYSAFGSKEGLYREALDRYLREAGGFYARVLAEETTARDAVARILREGAQAFTGTIGGCMLSTAALACAPEHQAVAQEVAALRSARRSLLAERITRGIAEGDVPAGVRPEVLAGYYMAVLQGMAVQAHDGADEATLREIADTAMRAWPQP